MQNRLSTGGTRPAFVLNRNAGGIRRAPTLVDAIVREVGPRADVFATSDEVELCDAARRIVESGASPVVLCGGDGTYLASVSAIARAAGSRTLPTFVLVRSGTVSTVARNWRGPKDALTTARRVVTSPESLVVTARPTLAVEDASGRRQVGFTFGTGLVASFFVEYERAGARGNLTALSIVLRVFAESFTGGPLATRILTPLPCRIAVGGADLEPHAFSLVVCSVLRDLGLHMLVTHRGGEDPARPHLVASPLLPRALGPQWPLVALGRRLLGPQNFDGLVGEFSVAFPSSDGPYVLDGDMFRSQRVTVRAGPVIRVAG
jgi:diacylglycerol kinase family enzyme